MKKRQTIITVWSGKITVSQVEAAIIALQEHLCMKIELRNYYFYVLFTAQVGY